MSTVAQEHALIEGIRSEMPNVVAIYLFGSAAAGELRTDSDIDLNDLRSTSTVMQAQIVSTGKRIYCANEPLCSEFEGRAYSDYARLNEERRYIPGDIRERGRIYG